MRQNKGDNITPEDLLAAMDLSVLDYNVKNYCDIDYKASLSASNMYIPWDKVKSN